MRILERIGPILLLLVSACSPTKPDDGTLHVQLSAVGYWPENVSLKIKVTTLDGDPFDTDPLADNLISEATAWGDTAVREAHAASGDSSVIETTFTLIAAHYTVSVWALTPWRLPYESQLTWGYATVKERKRTEKQLRIDFDDIRPPPQSRDD